MSVDYAKLNDLTTADWIKFTKSWFTLKPGATDREKLSLHPAAFPVALASDYISFFTREGEDVKFLDEYGEELWHSLCL